MSRRVVVTGLGTINPLGLTLKSSFDNLVYKKSGISYFKPHWLADTQFNLPPFPAAQIPDTWQPLNVSLRLSCINSN
jgi:3-oxoacyl-(acyl-carrier-protein) synthase